MSADQRAEAIRRRITAPMFGDRTASITDFGAVGDGRTDCRRAIAAAVDAVAAAGGGRVLVPAGRYRTGAVQLRDRIELHLAEDAVLEFSRRPEDYLPLVLTRHEGVECYNYSPFVYARGRTDIAITGAGVLDGRADADHWWDWTRGADAVEKPSKTELLALAATGVPVAQRRFGPRAPLRPSLVQFVDCRNVLIDGITVRNAPMWVLHPVLCRNVIISDVTVDSHGPNNDGCNPESCTDVLITGCSFDTGDDCIAIKAGKDADGRRVDRRCENVLITDCLMRAGHGGVTLGSETSGGIRNIVARRCRMDSPQLKRGLRLKSNPQRGGFLTDICFSDIEIGTVSQAVIEIALDYQNVRSGDHPPEVARIEFHRIRAREAEQALRLIGLPDAPITDVRLVDCRFSGLRSADVVEHAIGLEFEGMPQR